MTYTNALQVFFERLNYKHGIKGDSFLSMNHAELEELTDIMVACLIKLEKLLTKED